MKRFFEEYLLFIFYVLIFVLILNFLISIKSINKNDYEIKERNLEIMERQVITYEVE